MQLVFVRRETYSLELDLPPVKVLFSIYPISILLGNNRGHTEAKPIVRLGLSEIGGLRGGIQLGERQANALGSRKLQ